MTGAGGGELLTLVAGTSFAVSARSGDVDPGAAQGLFVRDARVLSRWRLLVDGRPPEVLAVREEQAWSATVVARGAPAAGPTEVLVERRRLLGNGLREDLRLRNLGPRPRLVRVRLEVGCDLASLFAVKARTAPPDEVPARPAGDALEMRGPGGRGVRVSAEGTTPAVGALEADLELPARGQWSTSVLVVPLVDDVGLPPPFPPGTPGARSAAARRAAAWTAALPTWTTPHPGLARTLRRSAEDLGALRLADGSVAAGAPWYMALFGRDALLTSWLALPLAPELALRTLHALAARQGRRVDPRSEEQPGRIPHEVRADGADFPLTGGAGTTYYGTADATPLFVVLLGELHRWGGLPPADRDALLPAADRALAWVEGAGDADGFVRYARATPAGLLQQGWKDSPDGITAVDGSVPAGPIALCEVQGYVVAAHRARAELAAAVGDEATAARCTERAERLRERFEERFWLPDRGWYAVALDGAGRPVDALTSNAGHCLWSGIAAPERAAAVAERLLAPGMLTGWGVRTLDTAMGAYNPLSYHNGPVWPHDSALVAAGLQRYGFDDGARRIAADLLDAAEASGGRLPELYGGFDRAEHSPPVPYPTSCSPQAWASAAPLTAVRVLLGLHPDLPRGVVGLDPDWPERFGPLRVEGLRLGAARVTLTAEGRAGTLEGLPPGVVPA